MKSSISNVQLKYNSELTTFHVTWTNLDVSANIGYELKIYHVDTKQVISKLILEKSAESAELFVFHQSEPLTSGNYVAEVYPVMKTKSIPKAVVSEPLYWEAPEAYVAQLPENIANQAPEEHTYIRFKNGKIGVICWKTISYVLYLHKGRLELHAYHMHSSGLWEWKRVIANQWLMSPNSSGEYMNGINEIRFAFKPDGALDALMLNQFNKRMVNIQASELVV